ncbi:MAG: PIN domain-containing protein [Saprospiraceae bacterium]
MKSNRRFTFIDYNNLRTVKLKSLDKLSERLYILVGTEHQSIPIKLVRKIQRMNCDVRWIIANNNDTEHVNFHIAFLMGKLHSKVDNKITFVVISNDDSIDSMITCVTDYGRHCTRVQRDTSPLLNGKCQNGVLATEAKPDENRLPFELDNNTELLQNKTIKETIRRLVYSSNPPVTISDLKTYIRRSNQESARYLNLEDIIAEMIRRDEIQVENGKIIYNFLPI